MAKEGRAEGRGRGMKGGGETRAFDIVNHPAHVVCSFLVQRAAVSWRTFSRRPVDTGVEGHAERGLKLSGRQSDLRWCLQRP